MRVVSSFQRAAGHGGDFRRVEKGCAGYTGGGIVDTLWRRDRMNLTPSQAGFKAPVAGVRFWRLVFATPAASLGEPKAAGLMALQATGVRERPPSTYLRSRGENAPPADASAGQAVVERLAA